MMPQNIIGSMLFGAALKGPKHFQAAMKVIEKAYGQMPLRKGSKGNTFKENGNLNDHNGMVEAAGYADSMPDFFRKYIMPRILDNSLDYLPNGLAAIVRYTKSGINLNSIELLNNSNETYAKFLTDGAVELYHDNVKKLESTSAGVSVTGTFTASSTVNAAGHFKTNTDFNGFKAGASDDLYMYHGGGQSYVTNITGNLNISSVEAITLKTNTNEAAVICNNNGSVDLYHNNSKKLETTSTGVSITGNVNATGNVAVPDDSELRLGATDDLKLYHDSSTGYNHINFVNGPLIFTDNTTHRAYFHGTDGHFLPWANNTYDLGGSSNRWRNIYTNDLNLSNEGSSNDVDGTWGSYTIQEGHHDLFLINKRTGKKYKFALTEVS